MRVVLGGFALAPSGFITEVSCFISSESAP
jgi:hypothetical protein